MHTKTQKLMLQGSLILLGALMVSSIGGWARRATADDQPAATAPAAPGDMRPLEQSLEATRGELAVARLQLERANAIIDYSTHYDIAADLSAAIYDIALAEGVDPALAFRLVKTESNFHAKAKSKVGALGCTSPGSRRSSCTIVTPTCVSGSATCGTCWSATRAPRKRSCAWRCSRTTAARARCKSCSTRAGIRRTA